MKARWVFFRLNSETTIALPLEEIHGVLHRNHPDYAAFAPGATSLAAHVEVDPDPDLPGVIVVLSSGDAWIAGDSSLEELPPMAEYLPLSPDLFRDREPWCRGVLVSGDRHAFVSDSNLLHPDGVLL